jgi:hypothetical protein
MCCGEANEALLLPARAAVSCTPPTLLRESENGERIKDLELIMAKVAEVRRGWGLPHAHAVVSSVRSEQPPGQTAHAESQED